MLKNNAKSQGKKIPVQTELLDAKPAAAPIEKQFATAAQLFPFTRYNDAKLRRLGYELNPTTNLPWLPKPVAGKYPLAATLAGVCAYKDAQIVKREESYESVWFVSMEACESRTGIPKTILQTAKKSGCVAFDHAGRVRVSALIKWLFTQGVAGENIDWTAHGDKFKSLNEEVKYRESIGELVRREEVVALVQEFSGVVFGGIKRLKLECPRDFEQRPKAYIKTAMEEKCAAIEQHARAQIQKLQAVNPTAEETAQAQK